MKGENVTEAPREILRVATDTSWHDMVAEIINKKNHGEIVVFEPNGHEHKGYEYPATSMFPGLTRAAQNFDAALKPVTPDDNTRRKEVKKAIKKVYKDQQPRRRFGIRRRK